MDMSSGEEDEDEQLKRALALSLQVQQESSVENPKKDSGGDSAGAIDLTCDDEKPSISASSVRHRTVPSEKAVGHGMLGLDRKIMEQERLERKRKATLSPPPRMRVRRTMETNTDTLKKPQPTPSVRSSFLTQDGGKTRDPPGSAGTSNTSETQDGRFRCGVVRKTWAFGFAREEDIKLEEVLERHDLTLAVLSSFQWDVAWLLGKLDTASTKLIMVMQAKDEATKQQYRHETAEMPNLRLCFPSMEGQINCMHSKLMLLAHPKYLRVVIPTANLVPYDWGESGVMENTVFIIDLPRQPKGSGVSTKELTFFGQELVYFCKAMGLPPEIINSLYDFDFSATNDIAFVHTIGGTHVGDTEPWRRTGYCGLGRAVRMLNLDIAQPIELDFIASSIGAITIEFLQMLYLAAQGDDGLKEFGWRTITTARRKHSQDQDQPERLQLIQEIENNFRLYFPSRDTVLNSKGGVECGGPICFSSRWYNAPSFPQKVLRDCKSVREGLLMHNKILYVQKRQALALAPSLIHQGGWAYIGSANCSESAWGKLVRDKGTKGPKLNCRNWECGVIIPVHHGETLDAKKGLDVFKGKIPVPIQYPAGDFKNRQPWYYAEE